MGSYWRQGVRVGGWHCTNLIFLAKIFPDTSVDKSCICLKSFSTNNYKQHTNYSVFFKVPDTVFTELFDTGTSWKMVNWQTTNRSRENIGGLTVALQKKKNFSLLSVSPIQQYTVVNWQWTVASLVIKMAVQPSQTYETDSRNETWQRIPTDRQDWGKLVGCL